MSVSITGVVQTGLGRGACFTGLTWARQQFTRALGIDPFPGTLNLQLAPGVASSWQTLLAQPGIRLVPDSPVDCAARCYPVRVAVAGRNPVTAAIVVPEVPGYPAGQVEVIASVSLRTMLAIGDGDVVTLHTVPAQNRCAVLFDVDGTLVNSIDGYRIAAERALEPFGWLVPPDAISRTMNFGEHFWDLVVPPESRGDQQLIAQLRRDTMAHWPAVLEESVLVYPGIGGILGVLKDAGVRLGICTASRGESFRPLERAGLLDLFEEIVTADDVGRRKPDPEGLLLCMERMGLEAGETVYIGDTVADMQASHAAGLYAIGVLTGAGTSSLLSGAGAHRILADLHDLPRLLLGNGSVPPLLS
ncbi:MAG: HAD-IA family hydrolase [Gammaproteobacteria bacterium]